MACRCPKCRMMLVLPPYYATDSSAVGGGTEVSSWDTGDKTRTSEGWLQPIPRSRWNDLRSVDLQAGLSAFVLE